ncbi:MAG: hypothetical protein A2790_10710 [Phenylobacterium sp. RIFCSPHIGHO2_01_FULL_69_31]|nr:MAG: hypothetical protein A2790_10710 [Phenylobacterium sp. RIFCSPHIGHO2_01_FULL_69_31]
MAAEQVEDRRDRPKTVAPTIPKNTAVPSAWRISAPGPLAITRGSTPTMKANEVIRIGRRCVCAASTAASQRLRPPVLALRQGHALVLGHQQQEDELHRQAEGDRAGSAGDLLLVGRFGPFVAEAFRQVVVGQLLHRRQRLASPDE